MLRLHRTDLHSGQTAYKSQHISDNYGRAHRVAEESTTNWKNVMSVASMEKQQDSKHYVLDPLITHTPSSLV